MAGARVAFVCVAQTHLVNNGATAADHITIHETAWAYCPSDVRADGHDWKATGGVTLGEIEILVRGMRERAGPAAAHDETKAPDRTASKQPARK
jgi:hypothetical protein